ncbi:hypothetical protein [Polynucleobacter sp. 80A-SIGWE]|uniref:hypothetical protein n=1 Tax=Polynucleobacter sp. 80A-SIGWE TaxID=2689100 RepID=UPI001C0AA1FD|nr:hypothetical protein [Polynucleobacter sp. 80A-SIGWE]MBU3588505.1 hypothetical protein [Polynucleobacter sp. 80A-SIGWE]
MTRIFICPSCSKKTGVEIIYGMPSEDLAKKAELGEIALGGCVIEPNQPNYRCMSCSFEWGRARQFEEAKQQWLKETVKGKSWTQMMDDGDKELNEKAKASMTPEYLAMWGNAEKDCDEGEGEDRDGDKTQTNF